MFYDLHVHTSLSIGENTLDEVMEFARRFNLDGIGVVTYYDGRIEKVPNVKGIDIVQVVMIKPSTPDDLNQTAAKIRSKAEIIAVHGGNYDINRAACESPLVDMLCHPELGRIDSGIDHICAKAAKDNSVAIEINFREILEAAGKKRMYIMAGMRRNIKLCTHYGTKIVTTSGAVSKWNLRSGRELAAVTHLLGMELGNAIATTSIIPADLVVKNRERLQHKQWEGLRVVD